MVAKDSLQSAFKHKFSTTVTQNMCGGLEISQSEEPRYGPQDGLRSSNYSSLTQAVWREVAVARVLFYAGKIFFTVFFYCLKKRLTFNSTDLNLTVLKTFWCCSSSFIRNQVTTYHSYKIRSSQCFKNRKFLRSSQKEEFGYTLNFVPFV